MSRTMNDLPVDEIVAELTKLFNEIAKRDKILIEQVRLLTGALEQAKDELVLAHEALSRYRK